MSQDSTRFTPDIAKVIGDITSEDIKEIYDLLLDEKRWDSAQICISDEIVSIKPEPLSLFLGYYIVKKHYDFRRIAQLAIDLYDTEWFNLHYGDMDIETLQIYTMIVYAALGGEIPCLVD